jgi:hypothetical protein
LEELGQPSDYDVFGCLGSAHGSQKQCEKW